MTSSSDRQWVSDHAALAVTVLFVLLGSYAMARYVFRAPLRLWNECVNQRFRYQLRYPTGYKIHVTRSGTETPELQPAQTCEGANYVVLGGPGENSLGIRVETQDDLSQTVYAGVTTLEELFARNPNLGDIRSLDHTQLGSEPALWQSGQLLVFHKGNLYTVTVRLADAAIGDQMLSSFSFR